MSPFLDPRAWAAIVLAGFLFASGWHVNGWRLGEQIAAADAARQQQARQAAEAIAARATTTQALQAAQAAMYIAEEQARQQQVRIITKEVVRYETRPYAGLCQLPGHWVRLDAAAALGLRPDPEGATGPDDRPSGFTDADALAISTERSHRYHQLVARFNGLRDYVRSLPQTCEAAEP